MRTLTTLWIDSTSIYGAYCLGRTIAERIMRRGGAK